MILSPALIEPCCARCRHSVEMPSLEHARVIGYCARRGGTTVETQRYARSPDGECGARAEFFEGPRMVRARLDCMPEA